MKIKTTLLLGLTFVLNVIAAPPEYPGKSRAAKFRHQVYKQHWSPEKMSAPQFHYDSHFKYIVNIIDADLSSFGRKKKVHHFAKILTNDPQKISENPRICTSFINQKHRKMFVGQIALILDVPSANIGPMRANDLGSHSVSNYAKAVRYFNRLFKKNPNLIATPEQLVKENPNSWNEILLTGNNKSSNTLVQAKGAIIRCVNWEKFKSNYELEYNIKAQKTIINLISRFYLK